MSLTPDVLSFEHSNEPKVNHETSSGFEEELKSARADAKETMLALLQFSEGVKLITRHMERATHTVDPAAEDEECKSEEEDIHNNNPSLSIETMVSGTRLQGTVFGTDLLRLWDAAHHVRDYARSVTEESTLSSSEVVDAQRTAKRALQRANKAETLALGLHRKNQDLRQQLDQVSAEKRRLIAEVKALRRQAANTRKMDMERLLQQHVAGAILLHEEQLKAIAAQEQEQQEQRRKTAAIMRERQEEEKKEEDEDMEVVVKAEDCGAAVGGVKRHVGSPKRSSAEHAGSLPTSPKRSTEADKENKLFPCDVSAKDAASVGPEALSTPSTPSSAYSPVKLFPASPAAKTSAPPPPPFASEPAQPSSARSVTSSTSNQSLPKPPPEQPRENVGSKVFNFLFHPEKIAQQRAQEMARQKQLEKQRQQPEPERAPKPKPNPLLGLDDLLMEEKDDASADATAPTQAVTTPGSKSCASSSLIRARPIMSGANKLTTPKEKQSQQQEPPHNINNTIIPECVSFLDDTLSVQSNLPSPNQSIISDEDPPQDVELYKDFKMFQSLAIPGDEEIDEYRQSRDAALKQ